MAVENFRDRPRGRHLSKRKEYDRVVHDFWEAQAFKTLKREVSSKIDHILYLLTLKKKKRKKKKLTEIFF